MKTVPAIPGTLEISFSILALACGSIEELIDKAWGGLDDADSKLRLLHTLECCCEGAHMSNFARHQELKSFFRPLVLCKPDQPLIDNLCACFCRDVAAQIDRQITRDFQVVCSPCI